MEQYDKNRITYAASYALLKRLVRKNIITMQTFEKLNNAMAECQVCDLLISHHCKSRKSINLRLTMRKGVMSMTTNKKVQIIRGSKSYAEDILRVAAYCRVSTDSEDQVNSFIAQMHYYYSFIKQAENMELVDVYADEGITGTSVAKRDDFNRMIKDCKAGKIDRIYVKSVSRFARNALECLEYLRILKECEVSVFFENDGIDTGALNSELILYIKAAFAEAESTSNSKRVQTANRMRAENGEYVFVSAPFGYRIENNELVPIPEEIKVVERIFKEYLAGLGAGKIAAQLNAEADMIGKPWGKERIRYILSNEKYIGDSLFQKTFTPNVLPLKNRPNRGEVEMYYISNTHAPAIDRELFDAVQEMLKRNMQKKAKCAKSGKYSLSGKLYCGDCGWRYKRKVQNGTAYWICSGDGIAGRHCKTKPLSEEVFFKTFVNFYNRLRAHENLILRNSVTRLSEIKKMITCMDSEISDLDKQLGLLTERHNLYVTLMQGCQMDEISFAEQCAKAEREINKLRSRRNKLLSEDEDEKSIDDIRMLRNKLSSAPKAILKFDFELFDAVVEKVIVEDDSKVSFVLCCGLKLREAIAWN